MIKAIFLDLDGTLLNSKQQVTPRTLRAIAACKANGIRPFIATGRPPLLNRMLPWAADAWAQFDGGVFSNGACVFVGEKKVYAHIAEGAVRGVLAEAEKQPDLNVALQLDDEVHAFLFLPDLSFQDPWGVDFADALMLPQADLTRVNKILVFYDGLVDTQRRMDKPQIDAIIAAAGGMTEAYTTDGGICVQMAPVGVSKKRGIETLRALLGYGADEIAVFGDDVNDIEMLSAYPNSYAMGNATDAVKAHARFTAPSNDEDGVARVMEDIIHSQKRDAVMEFRRANASDIPALLTLRLEFLSEANAVADDALADALRAANEDFLREGLADGSFVQLLAMDGEDIAATGSASFFRLPPNKGCPNGRCAYIGNMYTRPAYRRRGLGEGILSRLLDEAKARDCRKILLHATEMGRPLYQKLGFVDGKDEMVLKF